MVTGLAAIDHLRSARARREVYVGEWLPEPLLTDEDADPAIFTEQAELALARVPPCLLEQLNPVERACSCSSNVLQGTATTRSQRTVDEGEADSASSQTRARRHIKDQKPRFEASRTDRDRLAARFPAAVSDGDVESLVELLTRTSSSTATVAATPRAWPRPIFGNA